MLLLQHIRIKKVCLSAQLYLCLYKMLKMSDLMKMKHEFGCLWRKKSDRRLIKWWTAGIWEIKQQHVILSELHVPVCVSAACLTPDGLIQRQFVMKTSRNETEGAAEKLQLHSDFTRILQHVNFREAQKCVNIKPQEP